MGPLQKRDIGKVKLDEYRKYFSYSYLGLWSILVIIIVHILINLNNLAVGIYLAFTITNRLTSESDAQIINY